MTNRNQLTTNKGAIKDNASIVDLEEKREERKLRHWVIRVVILSFVSVFVPTVLIFMWSVATSDNGGGENVVTSFINAIVEIIHFMATPVK